MKPGRGSPRPAEDEVQWRFSGSGGPGGQHVNTANTKVECRFDIGAARCLDEAQRRRLRERYGDEIVVVCEETRSQWRNRQRALQRLVERIADGLVVEEERRPTRPTRSSRRRRLDAKRRRSQTKELRRRPDD